MKKIKIYRKNEYMNNMLNLDIYVNDSKYILSSNSSLLFNLEVNNIEIQAKYLWLTSKKIQLHESEKEFNIEILPIYSNKVIVIFAISMVILFFGSNLYENHMLDLLFLITFYSFFGIFIYFLTFGKNNYFKIQINRVEK